MKSVLKYQQVEATTSLSVTEFEDCDVTEDLETPSDAERATNLVEKIQVQPRSTILAQANTEDLETPPDAERATSQTKDQVTTMQEGDCNLVEKIQVQPRSTILAQANTEDLETPPDAERAANLEKIQVQPRSTISRDAAELFFSDHEVELANAFTWTAQDYVDLCEEFQISP
jgi:hypothetical protein